jgi:hypothetical protein
VADINLSQKEPVMQNSVLLQKIIHPTQLRSLALFLLYEPLVTHIRKPRVRPFAIHDISDREPLPGSTLSHIHVPPQLRRNSQKSISFSVSSTRVGLSDSLDTSWMMMPDTEVGAPLMNPVAIGLFDNNLYLLVA